MKLKMGEGVYTCGFKTAVTPEEVHSHLFGCSSALSEVPVPQVHSGTLSEVLVPQVHSGELC